MLAGISDISPVLMILVAVSLAFRAVDTLYRRVRTSGLATEATLPNTLRLNRRHRQEWVLALFPFVWVWLDIIAATFAAATIAHWGGYALAVLFVGSRLRALQEVAHMATHGSLGGPRGFQWQLADLLFQYPCFKPSMPFRFVFHVKDHHHHANTLSRDPNIGVFLRAGLTPGISKIGFHVKLFYPLTPAGLLTTLRTNLRNAFGLADGIQAKAVRILVVATTAGLFYRGFGLSGLLAGYVLPLITIYPLFSWVSTIAEHRWFARCEEDEPAKRECVNGRPTDFPGIAGWFIKHAIFPAADHFHLAHSLYPFVRWNYLPAIDRLLRNSSEDYERYRSEGLFFPGSMKPSALSELRDRLTNPACSDVAAWAQDLKIRVSAPVPRPADGQPTAYD